MSVVRHVAIGLLVCGAACGTNLLSSMGIFGGYLLSSTHFATHIRQGLSLFRSASSETPLTFKIASILLGAFGH